MSETKFFEYLPDGTTFTSDQAARIRLLYAPLSGVEGQGVKSCITPLLSGDIKLDKSKYLTKPVSREDLRIPVRNFFINFDNGLFLSAADKADDDIVIEMGQLWHRMKRKFPSHGLELDVLTFVPVSGESLELTRFTIKNASDKAISFIPTAVIPLFARALSNKHDHEHVTALLHRISQIDQGVLVSPTMLFNEEGHKPGNAVYYVFAAEGNGARPAGSFPTIESWLGDEGDWARPQAIVENRCAQRLSDAEKNGQEAVGAIRFEGARLEPGSSKEFIVAIGFADSGEKGLADFSRFSSSKAFDEAWEANRIYWTAKTATIKFEEGDRDFSCWMRWVTLQPVLRRIFGCSFLPDHDYGKGGKGWRDIWQDLLSLILIEPEQVRNNLLNNFAGIRIDGSNATIIGQKPGEFIADRNAITRVWMDHGVWPFATTLLYINQTGDTSILFEDITYFVDPQMSRTKERNTAWSPEYGDKLKDKKGRIYRGTVLEHILLQNLVQFFNVGEHNITRLESADWNDGLDMAYKRGESVAFMSFYAGNLLQIADLLESISKQQGLKTISIAREMFLLLDSLGQAVDYENIAEKKYRLFEEFFKQVQPELAGEIVDVPVEAVVKDLRLKGHWVCNKIQKQEKLVVEDGAERFSFFNGYYDNDGQRVEGLVNGHVRMTLTGQVFPVMHGVANREEVKAIIRSVERYLTDGSLGGVRLNTDFGVPHYLAMGRAFGFAFGTKENGAVFSHMAVMYAYALYKQGFAREGYTVLRSLYEMSTNGKRAKIYPGIPEYFDALGRGMYPFLTGSASWYVLTLLTMAYGVRGDLGDLVLAPKLVREEFSAGEARAACQFAGKQLTVTYVNPARLDYGQYRIDKISLNDREIGFERCGDVDVKISRSVIAGDGYKVDMRVLLSAS